MDIHGQQAIFIYGTPETQLVDWENDHMTIGLTHEMKLYDDVPPQFKDLQSMSHPGSLARTHEVLRYNPLMFRYH
jgi:hypothetical protein